MILFVVVFVFLFFVFVFVAFCVFVVFNFWYTFVVSDVFLRVSKRESEE